MSLSLQNQYPFLTPSRMEHTDTDIDGETTQPSPNEVKFDEAVKALLAENHEHNDLKARLIHIVMEEGKKHPPRNVLYCTSYGVFGFSDEFEAFLHSHHNAAYRDLQLDHYSFQIRSDPDLIQAISDYGRFICDRFPFILDGMRTVHTWKLDELLSDLSLKKFSSAVAQLKSADKMEFDPDLVTKATSFFDQMSDDKGFWRFDCLGSFPNGKRTWGCFGDEHHLEINLQAFTEMHPDFWMAQHCIGHQTFQVALRFAHILLQEGDRTRYHVEPDEAQDAEIYEYIGLCGSSKTESQLAIEEIPALVHYSITEYDGRETVKIG
jgi:hypothetical protein